MCRMSLRRGEDYIRSKPSGQAERGRCAAAKAVRGTPGPEPGFAGGRCGMRGRGGCGSERRWPRGDAGHAAMRGRGRGGWTDGRLCRARAAGRMPKSEVIGRGPGRRATGGMNAMGPDVRWDPGSGHAGSRRKLPIVPVKLAGPAAKVPSGRSGAEGWTVMGS
jgi:hypothetical protein